VATPACRGQAAGVPLDGRPLGSHRSAGFAHPAKRWFSLLMNPSAWIDDVKVYRVKCESAKRLCILS
jgi:hypothetical protein